jgi:phosphatidylglycerophosphate synthase
VGESTLTVWGLSTLDRMIRVGRRLGVADVAATNDEPGQGRTLYIRADVLIEDRLTAKLLARPGCVLAIDMNGRRQAVAVCAEHHHAQAVALLVDGASLADEPPGFTVTPPEANELCYDEVLRKRAVPFVLALTPKSLRDIEWRMFGASYKGATDFVTKWLWPVPAFHATRLCAKLGLSPNMVTMASFVLVLAAFALFWTGQFGLGIVCAWGMTFLDTVDGKLARVTVTSSKWGNIFDHGIDMIHPPFWYWAWHHGLGDAAGALHTTALWVIVAGYVVGRLIEGAFIAGFKFEMHVWRPFDFWLRAFTARRNPNMAILMIFMVLGLPDVGFLAVAAWTVICLLAHFVRLMQAYALKANDVPVRSYLMGGP